MSAPSLPAEPSLTAAVARLRDGGLVAFATETVYGLGADAGNPRAVAGIFAAKGRPSDHPLIVHIAEAGDLAVWAAEVSPAARALAAAFWPGPLTLILRRAAHVSDSVTGGQDTVGVRCPSHPLARALLHACRDAGIRGLAAPSANRFGRVSPTTAAHVQEEFGSDLLVLDGGACAVGIESTIVDVSDGGARVLRPGMLSAAEIAACVAGATRGETTTTSAAPPRVPGALAQHYAPTTPLELLAAAPLIARAQALAAAGLRCAVLAGQPALQALAGLGPGLLACPAPAAAADYARALYATLRALDQAGVAAILVESPPPDAAWDAVRDRLQRAAAGAGRHAAGGTAADTPA